MTREVRRFVVTVAAAALALVLLGLFFPPAHAAIHERAQQHRRVLIQSAHLQFGLSAPLSLFAAQVHQESAWRPEARSKYAAGLTQFTPDTAQWIARVYPRALGPAQPLSPKWALNAMSRYNRHLYDRTAWAATDCDRWAFVLSSYNGGAGNVAKDRRLCERFSNRPLSSGASCTSYAAESATSTETRKLCDSSRWWGHVEHHSPRARWAFAENRDYPKKIIHRWQPLYLHAGWGGPAVCLE